MKYLGETVDQALGAVMWEVIYNNNNNNNNNNNYYFYNKNYSSSRAVEWEVLREKGAGLREGADAREEAGKGERRKEVGGARGRSERG